MPETSWSIPVADLPEAGGVVCRDGVLFACLDPGTADGESVDGRVVVAYRNVCTHMGCRLVRSDAAQALAPARHRGPRTVLGPCPCHGSRFDLAAAGRVVFGPATARLPRLTVAVTAETVTATPADPDPLLENWPNQE